MAQPQHIEIAADIVPSRARVKRIIREADELNRELARLQARLEDAEARYAEVLRVAYRIDVRKDGQDA